MNWFDYWAEYIGFFLLLIGFMFAVSAGSAVILYIIAMLFGMLFGRWWWRYKSTLKTPIIVIILGFLVGFLLGSFYGSRKVIVILFFLGMVASYVLHDKKIIHSTEY